MRAAVVRRGAPAWGRRGRRPGGPRPLCPGRPPARQGSGDPRCAACSPPARGRGPDGPGRNRQVVRRRRHRRRLAATVRPRRPGDPDAGESTAAPAGDRAGPRVFGLAPYQGGRHPRPRGSRRPQHRRPGWRTAPARPRARGRRAADEPWRLRRGDLVVLDEAGTADTRPGRGRPPAARPRAPSSSWSATRASSARSARAGRCPTSPSTASSTTWPRSAGSPTTGKARRRCGCATATCRCSTSTPSTAGSSTAEPSSRPRPPPRAPGSPTPSPARSRC